MKFVILLASILSLANCQDDIASAIKEVFQTGDTQTFPDLEETDFLSELGEVVTKKPLQTDRATSKCGENEDQGVHACVPYFNCDKSTRMIIQTGQTDGFGVIDIRFKESPCDHYLDVCCGIPTTGPPANLTTQRPIIDPTEPSSTIPPPDPTRGNNCGIRNPNGIDFKINGATNHESEIGEFPWMVALIKKDYDATLDKTVALCGGSLISPTVVLTGAHCVHEQRASDLKIRAGEWDTATTRERIPYQERNVVNIIKHQSFHPKTLYNNVALLVLNEPLIKADNLGTICLPPQGLNFKSRNCFATGWGKDKFEQDGKFQNILKKIELPIIPHSQCQDALRTTRLGKFFDLHESFTCAGGEDKDTCTGDGGSPLVCPDPTNPGRYYQAGIVSWGIGCRENKIPGVYADVSKFRVWIDTEMDKLNLDKRPYIE